MAQQLIEWMQDKDSLIRGVADPALPLRNRCLGCIRPPWGHLTRTCDDFQGTPSLPKNQHHHRQRHPSPRETYLRDTPNSFCSSLRRLPFSDNLQSLIPKVSPSRALISQYGRLAFPSAPGVAQCGDCELPPVPCFAGDHDLLTSHSSSWCPLLQAAAVRPPAPWCVVHVGNAEIVRDGRPLHWYHSSANSA